MILKINTVNKDEVIVDLEDKTKKKNVSLIQRQKLGSQALLPLIAKILKKTKTDFSEISAVEVNPGPGSFTGTRVGVTVANVLGFILDIPVNGKKENIVVPKYEKSKYD